MKFNYESPAGSRVVIEVSTQDLAESNKSSLETLKLLFDNKDVIIELVEKISKAIQETGGDSNGCNNKPVEESSCWDS